MKFDIFYVVKYIKAYEEFLDTIEQIEILGIADD